MSKSNPSRATRISEVFLKELDDIPTARVKNDLEKRTDELTPAELTRMLVRTEGWQLSKQELMTKPRRRNE
jgi:hypothetical protein